MMDTIRLTGERISNKIYRVFSHEPWWTEFWSAAAALAWAYVSHLSGDRVYQHAYFVELYLIAKSQFWQVCAVILGLAQLSSLIYNNYKIRYVMCFLSAWFWTFLTVIILKSEHDSPGVALYASYACINLVSMIKLARSHV
jgi:hypothetical protein